MLLLEKNRELFRKFKNEDLSARDEIIKKLLKLYFDFYGKDILMEKLQWFMECLIQGCVREQVKFVEE